VKIIITSYQGSPSERKLVHELALQSGYEPEETELLFRDSTILIGALKGKHVAMAAYHVTGKTLVVDDVAVVQEMRMQGIATMLLTRLKEEAIRRNCRTMEITTSNDNIPALACYQKYGFHIREGLVGRCIAHHGGIIPGWSGIPVRDEIILEYELQGGR
jgi:ribosomal protein S18 acetylase RimI-like enzyme